MTLYTQVDSNRRKTVLFLAFYVAIIVVLGYVLSRVYGNFDILLFAGVVSLVQGWASWFYSDHIALAAARAAELDRHQYDAIYKLVENLSITAGLPMPKLYLIDDTAINAFATGRDPKNASLAITRGAIEKLTSNELQGVLAHELSHVGNEDIRLMSMVMVMAGLIALVSDIFLRSLWWGGGRRDNRDGGDANSIMLVIAIALAVLAPIAASLIQLAVSRKREFMADANGVLLTRYPEGLISALRKIERDEEPLEVANRATAHMYFTNPLSTQRLAHLFDTHPPIEDRIKALAEGGGLQA